MWFYSELNQRMAGILTRIQQSGTQAPPEEILRKQVLEQLISERLQLNMGYNASIRVSDEEINQTLARVAASSNLSLEDYIAQIHASGGTLANVRQEDS